MANHFNMKKVIAFLLLIAVVVSLTGCKKTGDSSVNEPDINNSDKTSDALSDKNTPQSTDSLWNEDDWNDKTTSDPSDDRDDNENSENEGIITESNLNDTVLFSNTIANKIQAAYTDGNRNGYKITNENVFITEKLSNDSNTLGTTLTDRSGNNYFENSLDVYAVDDKDIEYSILPSLSNAKVNTTKLGYYYYDINIRDIYMGYQGSVSYPDNNIIDLTPSLWSFNNTGVPYTDGQGNFSVKVSDPYDPYFYRTGLSVDGRTFNAIEITLKTDNKDTVNCMLYYYTADRGGFSEDQTTFFKLDTDGEFHTYLVPLNPLGKIIDGIRFDIGTSAGETVTVKSAKFAYTEQSDKNLAAEKTFHSYPDKVHFEASVLSSDASSAISGIKEYGYKISLKKSDVSSFIIGEDGGTVAPEMFKVYKNPEYIGIDVKSTGVVGFIIPDNGVDYGVKISDKDDFYTIYVFNKNSKTIRPGNPVSLSSRIYTDSSHSFEGIAKVANQERNPFTGIDVKSKRKGTYVGYDYAVGAYGFSIDGTDFNTAYSKNGKNRYYSSDISITANDDRVIYVYMKTDSGGLEGAAIATKDGISLPIPIEVCKNFHGEFEESIYDPEDASYGYAILPIKTSANSKYEFTLFHLYQNWGKYPIKQISSIAFHVSYYHLSTGVTESNCIAPYYVYGKDGWTLPDFRGASGVMWSGQPQFNSVGRLYFTKHKDKNGNFVLSEYTGSDIHSSGNTYADIDYSYIADDGAYKYDLRHFELPQTDENRTMYELSLEFLQDTSFDDVKNELSLFSFDGRFVTFSKASYRAEDNTSKIINNSNTGVYSDVYILGKDAPFFSFYDFKYKNGDTTNGMNFGLIIRDSYVTNDGKSWDGNFVFKNEFDGSLNIGTLSLNMGKATFKKGDKIVLNLILLPYGLPDAKDSKNVDYVIEDSLTCPFTVSAEKGTVVHDKFLPSVNCVDDEAVFTVSGGRNNQVIKVTGCSKLGVPEIFEKIDGKWETFDYHVKGLYDGYTVQYEDGCYSYSFVCDMGDSPETAQRTFKIVI